LGYIWDSFITPTAKPVYAEFVEKIGKPLVDEMQAEVVRQQNNLF